MIRRITTSINIAVHVAILGFQKSYNRGETIDSILGYTDFLTRIPNRKAFERDRKKIDERYSLIMIDIDDFKKINDNNGHLFGDKILKRLAKMLKELVSPDGRVYRIGGDEFILIIPKSRVKSMCIAIRQNLRREDSFTISQGVVLSIKNGVTEDTIQKADTAMYRSKARGKDRITTTIPAVA